MLALIIVAIRRTTSAIEGKTTNCPCCLFFFPVDARIMTHLAWNQSVELTCALRLTPFRPRRPRAASSETPPDGMFVKCSSDMKQADVRRKRPSSSSSSSSFRPRWMEKRAGREGSLRGLHFPFYRFPTAVLQLARRWHKTRRSVFLRRIFGVGMLVSWLT